MRQTIWADAGATQQTIYVPDLQAFAFRAANP